MERRKFEDSLKDAFKDAEVEPSGRVWSNIELDLIKAESSKMKRRVFFYQMLAAASVAFAMIISGLGFYAMSEKESVELAYRSTDEQLKKSQQELARIAEVQNDTSSEGKNTETDREALVNEEQLSHENTNGLIAAADQHINRDANGEKKHNSSSQKRSLGETAASNGYAANTTPRNNITGREDHSLESERDLAPTSEQNIGENSQAIAATLDNKNPESNQIVSEMTEHNLPGIASVPRPALTLPAEEEKGAADPVALMLAKANDRERELANSEQSEKKNKSQEKLWTSVGFAAGAFNSGAPSGNPGTMASPAFGLTSNTAAQNQTKASGISYSLGVSVGTRIADRWVLQGGVNYLTEMSDYTSTQAVQKSGTFKAASVNQFRSSADASEKFIPTAPYTVNNSNEYLSVPLQAGYLIVKRKIVWQLNAGISTDLFLQNTVDPEGNIEKTTSRAGDDSPFRTVNFSGLIGSEISYRFGDHYRLGLNPGLRYPLNSIYKDNLGLESSPFTFDVGLRFRYIFH